MLKLDIVVEFLKLLEPKKFIMFTDGYPCGEWGDADYCDALFIVKGGDNEAPFGQTVLYDKEVK